MAKVKTKDTVNPFAHIEAASGKKKKQKKKFAWYDPRAWMGSYGKSVDNQSKKTNTRPKKKPGDFGTKEYWEKQMKNRPPRG